MNSKKRLFQNTVIYFIGNFATKLLTFFMLPLYTQYLNPSDYGDFDTVQGLTTMLVPILFIQISDAIIRMLLEEKEREARTKYITNALVVLGLGTLGAAIVIPIICISQRYDFGLLFYLYFILHAWHVVLQQIVRSLGHVKLYAMGGIVSTLTTVGLNLIFILGLHMKADALFLSAIGTSLITSLIMFFGGKVYRYISIKSVSTQTIRSMARYSIPLIPNTLSWQMITTFSRLYLRSVCGATQQGLFSVANRFPNLITMLTGIFYLAWQEVGILVYNTEERDDTYSEVCNGYINTLLAGMIVLLPLSKWFIQNLLGIEYAGIWIYIPLMMSSATISAVTSFLGTAYLGKKNTKRIMKTSLIAAMVNVVVLLLTTKRTGIWGVAISGFLSYTTLLIIRWKDIKGIVKISLDFRRIVFATVAFFTVAFVFYFVSTPLQYVLFMLYALIVAIVIMYPFLRDIVKGLLGKRKNYR